MGIFVTRMALMMLSLAAGGVYAMHVGTLPGLIGVAIALSLLATLVPSGGLRVSPAVPVVVAVAITGLGLVIVWATSALPLDRSTQLLRDLGWTEVALGGWLVYASLVARSARAGLVRARFDDAARARWREGDMAFGADLAGRLVVGAQPSWVALVIEVAWPEPRSELVEELLGVVTTAGLGEIMVIRQRFEERAKLVGSGDDVMGARWELARIACDVIREARERSRDDVGGAAVGRFVVAAARVVQGDDDAARIFAALVLPAMARDMEVVR